MFFALRSILQQTSLAFALGVFLTTPAHALMCSDYRDFKAYGTHYYSVTVKRMTFKDAQLLAQNNGGYLAIPDTSGENAFIARLVRGGQYAWIGVYDPDYTSNYCYEGHPCVHDDNRFKTVKNKALIYKNWANDQPDNLLKSHDIVKGKDKVSPLGEHWVALGAAGGQWGDFGNHFDEYNNPLKYYGVYEFDALPECYRSASTVMDQLEGIKCNTKIYDHELDGVRLGETFDCQEDQYGTAFCPSSLALCKEYFDYDAGFSQKKSNFTIEYTDLIKDLIPKQFITFSTEAIVCNDHYLAAFLNYVPSHNTIQILYINASPDRYIGWNCGYGYKLQNVSVDFNASKPFKANIHSRAGGCWTKDYTTTFSTLPTSAQLLDQNQMRQLANKKGAVQFRGTGRHDKLSPYSSGYYKYNIAYCPAGGAQSPYVSFAAKSCPPSHPYYSGDDRCYNLKCPEGYDRGETQCSKKMAYTYYEYKCKKSPNLQHEHYVPRQTGGDCAGKGLIDTDGDGIADSCNDPKPPDHNCKRKGFACKASANRPCVWVDHEWQCSPFPCLGKEDIQTTDTPVGLNDANNQGWSENGNCSGQIYIFNGKEHRCRSEDVFFGLTGGGCCDKDKVFLGLVDCKEEEIQLARLNQRHQCYEMGEYCSKTIGFITSTCIQHKKTFCCFNSQLGRIINQQGRPQINKSWGSVQNAQCKGFTPEEFSKLNLGAMDLSAFYKELEEKLDPHRLKDQQTFIQDRLTQHIKGIK